MTFPESDSLRSRTVHALSWSFLESLGLKGVQFLIGVLLARLLLPEQFGLIGMLTIFMAVAQSFLDSGFGAALIRKREATATDTCSIFYFNNSPDWRQRACSGSSPPGLRLFTTSRS